MKNFIKIFVLGLLLNSCGDFEPVVFDSVNGETLVTFGVNASNLQVIIDDAGSVDIPINVTTSATVDRTVSISVDTESSTANPENYTVPATMVIPANEYIGTLTVTGVDNSVETAVETIVLKFDSVEGGIVSPNVHTVSIFQICPTPETYMVGDYLLTDNGNGNFGADVPVTISVDADDPNKRTFVAEFLPGTGVAQDVDVYLRLICNTIFLEEIDINVTCNQGTPDLYKITTAGSQSSSYDLSDDTLITVNYLEDPDADCGPAVIQNFTLTKQ